MLLHFPRSKDDPIATAHRTSLWRIGPLSLLFYVLHRDQYHPRQLLRITFHLHLQYGARCLEVAV